MVGEVVVHADSRPVAFCEAQGGAGNAAIQRKADDGFSSRGNGGFGNMEVVFDGAGVAAMGCCGKQEGRQQWDVNFHGTGKEQGKTID